MNRLNNSLLSLVAISASSVTQSQQIAAREQIIRRSISSSPSPASSASTTGPAATSVTLISNTNMTNAEQDKSKKTNEASEIIRNSNVVCFDVDSTVIMEEGIDELAKFCGKGQEVARLTKEAMKGSMTFQEALQIRLNIIKPSQRQIRDFLKAHPSTLSFGIKELINRLRANNVKVYLISGGFDCLIEPVATELGIPLHNMYANRLFFTFNGDYAGFDTTQPTSHSGGKGEAIQLIRQQLADDANITMIGDGATDLEASPPADYFIGYGGNIVREEVRARANFYVTNFEQISGGLV